MYVTIGELARLVHRHPDTLRDYERRGIIPPAARDPINRFRLWSEEEVEDILKKLSPCQENDAKLLN